MSGNLSESPAVARSPSLQVKGAKLSGQVSQSGQWAPFNYAYLWFNTSQNLQIEDPSISVLNGYIGSDLQQATSVVTETSTCICLS